MELIHTIKNRWGGFLAGVRNDKRCWLFVGKAGAIRSANRPCFPKCHI